MELMSLIRRGRRLRTIGVDDGPFEIGRRRDVLVVGAVYSAAQFEGLLTTHVRQDGFNATARLVEMLVGSKFHAQLHVVMLDGITLGGFNVVDLPGLSAATGLPCLAVMRRPPNQEAIERALAHLTGCERRRRLIERAGPIHPAGPLCFQAAGLDPDGAREILKWSAINGWVPECLRAAHLIASGVISGESGHRA
jgi:uncharacterized protein